MQFENKIADWRAELDQELLQTTKIAVVVPSFRVKAKILSVIENVGSEVDQIFVVDDRCPEQTGAFVEAHCRDKRVRIIASERNMGVGGATMAGFERAIEEGAEVIVKLDGDGQMDPTLIPYFCYPILKGDADYAKGNRFFEPESTVSMPTNRLIGNMGLSFAAKLSTGYWHIMDPTNGYFAIHAKVAKLLPFEKIAQRYFFESDLLFRLNTIGARVVDVPMHAVYEDEVSNLNPAREMPRFAAGHIRNTIKRIVYNYFIRGFSLASVELVLGICLIVFGFVFGISNWGGDTPATAGTVMLAALPLIVGVQLVLNFVNHDVNATPSTALHKRLGYFGVLPRPKRQE